MFRHSGTEGVCNVFTIAVHLEREFIVHMRPEAKIRELEAARMRVRNKKWSGICTSSSPEGELRAIVAT